MRYLIFLLMAGCVGDNRVDQALAQTIADNMVCATSKRQVCVCVYADNWSSSLSGITIDPTGASCH
jgi:hypothetical protein